ncbi:MAG: hypothetical protein ACREQ9_26525 [Candidatus Binatia bacterium]
MTTHRSSGEIRLPGLLPFAVGVTVGAITLLWDPASAGNGCVASYGPQNDYRRGSCSYVAGGDGQYSAAVVGADFRIYVGGMRVVSGNGGSPQAGAFAAMAGETVTVEVECERIAYTRYCVPWGEAGAVAAGDR